MPRTIDEYLSLPYAVSITPDTWDDGTVGYFIEVEELPGCMTQGRTPEEAFERIHGAMRAWITVMLEDGKEIPEPRALYSGQFMLRLPRDLHGELVRRARQEGVSLNQFAATTLAGAVGWKARASAPDAA